MNKLAISYIPKLKDEGMRKVAILRLIYNHDNKKIAKMLKLKEETVETIGKKAGMTIQAMVYDDMKKKGIIFNGKNNPV